MIYLGLPAFNEELSIDPLFQRIYELQQTIGEFPVLLYDDGSTDSTAKSAQAWVGRLDVTVVDGVVNQGLGAALRGLIATFLDTAIGGDVLVLMDCDDTHDPAQIPDLVQALPRNSMAVSIASRYRKGSTIEGVPIVRTLASTGVLAIYKSVFPMRDVRDYSCGYRAYTYEVLDAVAAATNGQIVDENGFASMPELLLRTRGTGAKFNEIPLHLHYGRRLSESKMPVTDNSLRLLRNLVQWRRTLW